MSYGGHSLGAGSYTSAEMQSVYDTAPANWSKKYNKNPWNLSFFLKTNLKIELKTIQGHMNDIKELENEDVVKINETFKTNYRKMF